MVRFQDRRWPAYPYDLSDLLLAVEIPSPGNAAYDYQRKRELYLRSGVEEYWVVNAEARNVSRWREVADPGEVLSEHLEWNRAGMPTPLAIHLPSFFDAAVA